MLTGLYPHQNVQLGLSHLKFQMYEAFPSIPTFLHSQGYFTGIIGKRHVAPKSAFKFNYQCGGFDTPYEKGASVMVKEPRKLIDLDWNEKMDVEKFTRMVKDVTDTTASFIRLSGDQSFFLMLNLLDPHLPFFHQVDGYPENPLRPEEVNFMDYLPEEVRTDETRNKIAGYYNGCTRADAAFGKVIEHLKAIGEYDNTLIVFLGDHGAPFPRAKTTNYEAGLKVPFIVKYPYQTEAAVREEFVSTVDLFPTVIDLLDAAYSADLPGKSIQQKMKSGYEEAFGDYNFHGWSNPDPNRSISTPRYKLIHHLFAKEYEEKLKAYEVSDFKDKNGIISRKGMEEYELFDLKNDPQEWNNLADNKKYKAVFEELKSRLYQWQLSTNDIYLQQDKRKEFTDLLDGMIKEELAE
jgi:N-sulfoglucosamine sulfohydrolase